MTPNQALARIANLNEVLDIEHDKLCSLDKDLALSSPGIARATIRVQIKEVWSDIRTRDTELAGLLAEHADLSAIDSKAADDACEELIAHVERIKTAKGDWPDEVLATLSDIKAKLDEPKQAAAAKLKVSLPIVPLLISYDLELDTESTVVQVWHKITGLFRKSVKPAADPT